jgi:DNA-directed RNA polymerase specialized sigma24 family protein
MPNQGMTEASIRPGLGEWEHMQVHDSGHTARLAALYESHATDVFHLTGRREDAEDVVQFVFLQAFATHETGTELLHPRKWLIKAAKHRSLNMLRDRREATVEGGELRLAARDQPDPEEAEALASVRSMLWALHAVGAPGEPAPGVRAAALERALTG